MSIAFAVADLDQTHLALQHLAANVLDEGLQGEIGWKEPSLGHVHYDVAAELLIGGLKGEWR